MGRGDARPRKRYASSDRGGEAADTTVSQRHCLPLHQAGPHDDKVAAIGTRLESKPLTVPFEPASVTKTSLRRHDLRAGKRPQRSSDSRPRALPSLPPWMAMPPAVCVSRRIRGARLLPSCKPADGEPLRHRCLPAPRSSRRCDRGDGSRALRAALSPRYAALRYAQQFCDMTLLDAVEAAEAMQRPSCGEVEYHGCFIAHIRPWAFPKFDPNGAQRSATPSLQCNLAAHAAALDLSMRFDERRHRDR